MWIFWTLIIALAIWAAAASVVVALHDGYRRVPTCATARFENEGIRNG
jgi:hypothetical protein